jgi:hypothetical protein
MSQRSVGDPYPTQANGSPACAAMDLEDLETWYRTQAMNELIGAGDVDVDPETEHPPYRWMNSR